MSAVKTPLKPLGPSRLNQDPVGPSQPTTDYQPRKALKKKEKLSALCKTPPAVIRSKTANYERGLCIGEGGFARCFQVKDGDGQRFAAKTVAKASLTSDKAKRKLLAEIKIHKATSHPNVVKFENCFEDSDNVYILMEICTNQSLMDMLKRRKVLTEAEARLLMVQLAGAVKYMHKNRIMHRDLKLGNILLDKDMTVKVGDFGLACVMDGDDRRRSMCGTPNYIAPEVLGGKHVGHSYEVDIWSMGIILYTLLHGTPPFQSKDVNTIYQRILKADYTFSDRFSESAKELIRALLQLKPENRPTVDSMLKFAFFKDGPFPDRLTPAMLDSAPSFASLTSERSEKNFFAAQVGARIFATAREAAEAMMNSSRAAQQATPVQAKSPAQLTPAESQPDRPRAILPSALSPASTRERYKMVALTQAAPGQGQGQGQVPRSKSSLKDEFKLDEAAAPLELPRAGLSKAQAVSAQRRDTVAVYDDRQEPVSQSAVDQVAELRMPPKIMAMKSTADTITKALCKDQLVDSSTEPSYEVFVVKWIDYTGKAGFAYQLSSGRSGVLFNDGTNVFVDGSQYNQYRVFEASMTGGANGGGAFDRIAAEWTERPANVTRDLRKLKYVRQFAGFMNEHLQQNAELPESAAQAPAGAQDLFVTHFRRHHDYTALFMSNNSFQFNFDDHCKLLISNEASQVSFIDPRGRLHLWSMTKFMAKAEQMYAKYHLLEKLKVCRKEIDRLWMEAAAVSVQHAN